MIRIGGCPKCGWEAVGDTFLVCPKCGWTDAPPHPSTGELPPDQAEKPDPVVSQREADKNKR